MKKTVLLLILLAVCHIASANSKDDSQTDGVRSNHSISVTTIGAEYSYEQRLGDRFSIVGRLGMLDITTSYNCNVSGFSFSTTIQPAATIEPRFYTSMGRRIAMGRDTHNNSSDFVSVAIRVYSDFEDTMCFVSPCYGIRRTWGKHWFGEGIMGIRIGDIVEGADLAPECKLRIGFIF